MKKKFYRYMSKKELSLLSAGCEIRSLRHHSRYARTSSDGVCFLAEEVVELEDEEGRSYTPIGCSRFLSGIVSRDMILVEFEGEESLFTEEYGVYADPYGWFGDLIEITEYSIPMYSIDILTPLRYCVVDDSWSGCREKTVWYDWH